MWSPVASLQMIACYVVILSMAAVVTCSALLGGSLSQQWRHALGGLIVALWLLPVAIGIPPCSPPGASPAAPPPRAQFEMRPRPPPSPPWHTV